MMFPAPPPVELVRYEEVKNPSFFVNCDTKNETGFLKAAPFQDENRASEDQIALDKYFDLLKKYPGKLDREGDFNDHTKGAYEIVYDKKKIQEIHKLVYERLIKKGISEDSAASWSRPGVVYEDNFWIWIRDVVIAPPSANFPNGFAHTYNRLIWKSQLEGIGGAAVMPISTVNGQEGIFLILAFRHATNSFEFEIPRGGSKPGETPIQTAQRELKEETGFFSDDLMSLGTMTPDSGTLVSFVPVFAGHVSGEELAKHDKTEAITGKFFFTISEIEQGLIDGYLTIIVEGEKRVYPLRDSFLTYAFLLAKLNKLL